MNNISPVSFQGSIKIHSYKDSFLGEFLPEIHITPAQSREIEDFVSQIISKDKRPDTVPTRIKMDVADRIYNKLSEITGIQFRNVRNQKALHYDDGHIIFGDVEGRYCQGEYMTINLDA